MLKECLGIFGRKYAEIGEQLITDNYVLAEGAYILVGKKGEITTIKEAPKPKDFSAIGFESFIIKDYLSKLIDMNKPVDPKKIVHSNNYCTFWLKKESLKPDKNGMIKLSREIIENYYSILSNPHLKYKGKGLDLYKTVENEIGLPNLESLEFCKAWILDNVYTIIEKCGLKDDKSYIKIYFEFEESVYRNESKRYTVPSIYNTTDYNIMHNDQIFGLPNNNMGLNSKKPYLENKTRKNKLPYLISAKEVMLQKSFFDYLYNHANNGKTNIYLSEKNGIKALGNTELLNETFSGYYLRIKKGKELEILDFDIVTRFNPKIEPVYFKQIIPVPLKSTSDFIYEKVDNLEVIKNIINSTFFKKFLSNNYFTEAKDIKLNDFRVKEELLKCRNGYFNWFFKGDKRTVKSFFGDSTLQLVKNSIGLGNYFKAIEQFNVRDALIIYLNGGSDMADKGKMIADHLRQEINGKETGVILTDEEYYFAAGQLAQYILGFNQSNKPTYALINPILNGKTNDKLKENIKHLFLKYDYAIQPSKRFKNLYAMFILYQAEKEKIDEEMLIAGYLYSPLIYEKKVEEEKNNDAE